LRAIILAGGKGRRLSPYTTVLPKPLMPIGDYSILEVVIRQLKAHGFKRITMAVGYLSELIRAYLGDGKKLGIPIDYSFEEKPLGTMGPISLIDGLDDTFLVMNGDILTTLDYSAFVRFHKRSSAIASIATHRRKVNIAYGVIETDDEHRITNYTEKPALHYRVSMGIYLFEPEVLRYMKRNSYLNLPDLVLRLVSKGEKVMSYHSDAYWLDIGIPEEYAKAIEDFEKNPAEFLPRKSSRPRKRTGRTRG